MESGVWVDHRERVSCRSMVVNRNYQRNLCVEGVEWIFTSSQMGRREWVYTMCVKGFKRGITL